MGYKEKKIYQMSVYFIKFFFNISQNNILYIQNYTITENVTSYFKILELIQFQVNFQIN